VAGHDDKSRGSGGRRSPKETVSPLPQVNTHCGRKLHPGSLVRIGTTGMFRGIKRSNLARLKSNCISHPLPRKIRDSPFSLTWAILPSIANVSSLPTAPETCTRADWCLSWFMNSKKASRDEPSFVIALKYYGFSSALSPATEHGWDGRGGTVTSSDNFPVAIR